MRWLIALIIAAGLASVAHAQQASDICPHYDKPWAAASASGKLAMMEQLQGQMPAFCPLKAQAQREIAALLKKQRDEQQRQAAARAVSRAAIDSGADRGAEADNHPSELADLTPPAPTAPVDPCSIAGVEWQFSKYINDFRPALSSLSPQARAALADEYIERGKRFVECNHAAQAPGDFRDAEALNPKSFSVFMAEADIDLASKDFQAAYEAYSRAIGNSNTLSAGEELPAYAGRLTADLALSRDADEISDLRHITGAYSTFNNEHNVLKEPSYYHELLGKALYRSHDDAGAAAELGIVNVKALDWEDLRFLAEQKAKTQQWPDVIDQLTRALGLIPDSDALRVAKAGMEVSLGRAYQGRDKDGDQRSAWDAYHAALTLDGNNADARAALASFHEGPPPPPTFEQPELAKVQLPDQVENLASDSPQPFCTQTEKNNYLDTIKAASATVNSNMANLGRVILKLLSDRQRYADNTLLTYAEKIADLARFDDQWNRLDAMNTAQRRTGDALMQFYARVTADEGLVRRCATPNNAAGR